MSAILKIIQTGRSSSSRNLERCGSRTSAPASLVPTNSTAARALSDQLRRVPFVLTATCVTIGQRAQGLGGRS